MAGVTELQLKSGGFLFAQLYAGLLQQYPQNLGQFLIAPAFIEGSIVVPFGSVEKHGDGRGALFPGAMPESFPAP